MRLPRASLVRRLTVGFIIANAAAVLLFCVAILYVFALIEEDEPIGPEVVLALVQRDLSAGQDGGPILRSRALLDEFTRDHPGTWFVVQGSGREISFGPVPEAAKGRIAILPGTVFEARYRNLGTAGPAGDAMTAEVEIEGKKLLLTAGGVVSKKISFSQFVPYLQWNDFFWIPVFTAIFNLAGILVAIPIVIRSLRPTAQAAAELDSADMSKRLPERKVVKELLPLVRAFNAALDRLAEGFERRRRFIADVAHELRTPLAVLNMHVEALPDGSRKADLQRLVFRLGQMVGQMLDAARLALSGRRHEPVDLVELARLAVADAAPLAVANGYEIAFSAETHEVVVSGDVHSISRAVTNLIGNALAHGGGSGTIEVRVSADAAVVVRDEGPGIPIEARERIFEPFRRERWDKDGCGLGLHLVREIMRAHGGKAEVVGSRPGAVFRLEFPPVQLAA